MDRQTERREERQTERREERRTERKPVISSGSSNRDLIKKLNAKIVLFCDVLAKNYVKKI